MPAGAAHLGSWTRWSGPAVVVATMAGEPPSLTGAVREVRAAQDRRREQLARDLADTPDPALKMRIAELVAHREQCCAGTFDCYADWELTDLRWVLARRAECCADSEERSD